MAKSKIEWTEVSWNPITGCSKVSPGCKYCYAERMAKRLSAMKQENYANGFHLTMHKHMLNRPLQWKKPKLIFVNSMSDLFHEEVPFEFIAEVFNVMGKASWHTYQILTKRSDRLFILDSKLNWLPNIWMGVSIENNNYAYRADHLKKTSAHIKYLSLEPLLGSVNNLNLKGIDWVIVGGESGPHARPIKEEWVLEIQSLCRASNVPFFFKQWGGHVKKRSGRLLNGKVWDEMPHIPDSNKGI